MHFYLCMNDLEARFNLQRRIYTEATSQNGLVAQQENGSRAVKGGPPSKG